VGTPILDLGNSQNWNEAFPGISRIAATTSSGGYVPIAEIIVPVLLEARILAVLATSSTAKSYQVYAGVCIKKVRTGILVGGLPDTDAAEARKLYLNRITLMKFEQVTADFQISFKPSWRLSQIDFRVWKYTGIDSNTLDDSLNVIGRQVVRTSKDVELIRATVENRSPFQSLNPFGFGL
jgi:hypothetical protein